MLKAQTDISHLSTQNDKNLDSPWENPLPGHGNSNFRASLSSGVVSAVTGYLGNRLRTGVYCVGSRVPNLCKEKHRSSKAKWKGCCRRWALWVAYDAIWGESPGHSICDPEWPPTLRFHA